MVRQRLVGPKCRLRVFSNSVKCGGCNCLFHAGTEKCAKTDTANWSESWCCPNCFSKKMPINLVNSLNSPVLPSPCTPCSPNSRARMLNTLKELKSLVFPSLTPASPYLQHEGMPQPLLNYLVRLRARLSFLSTHSTLLTPPLEKLYTCSHEASVQTKPYSYVDNENLTYSKPCVNDFACQTNLDTLKPESPLWLLKLKDRLEELISYILTIISEPLYGTQKSDTTKNNEVNQVKIKIQKMLYCSL